LYLSPRFGALIQVKHQSEKNGGNCSLHALISIGRANLLRAIPFTELSRWCNDRKRQPSAAVR
jgi:hypothetical protein